MSDQGIWFKLWDGWENDADLANLSKEDLLHWVLLGGYLKKHGNNGMTCLSKPATALQKKLMLGSYEAVVTVLKRFPNCVLGEKQNQRVTNSVTSDDIVPDVLTITWQNWRSYQGDSSRERMRRLRKKTSSQDSQKVTIKKRGEEKRGEDITTTPIAPKGAESSKILEWFEHTWKHYPKERRVGKKAAFRSYQKDVKDVETAREVARALEIYLASQTVKDGFVKNASTFFSNWKDFKDDQRRSSEGVHGQASIARPDSGDAGTRVQAANADTMLHKLADGTKFPE